MPKLNDLDIARLKNDYIAGAEPTKAALWERLSRSHKVSVPTIRRYADAGGWETLRQEALGVQQKFVLGMQEKLVQGVASSANLTIAGQPIATDKMLDIIIADAFGGIQATAARSKESLIIATLKAVELKRKIYPPTMDEFIDLALSIPGFDVREFAQKLRERLERSA